MDYFGNVEGVNGVKTGFTNKAGRCIVVSVERGGFSNIAVILGADTKNIRAKDSVKLVKYVYDNYELVDIEKIVDKELLKWERTNQRKIYINKGKKDIIKLKLGASKYSLYPIKKGEINNIRANIQIEEYLEAPVEQEQVVGIMQISIGEQVIEEVEILNKEKIEKKKILTYFNEFISNYDIILRRVIEW